MKVKISYTTDTDNIPVIIGSLAKEAQSTASKVVELCNKISTNGDHGIDSLNKTAEVKQLSAEIVEYASDMEGILSAFLVNFAPKNTGNANEQQKEQQKEQTETNTEVPMPQGVPSQLGDIANKIDQLKKLAAGQEVPDVKL